MQPFRFVHAADLHIDSPFAGIGETDKHVAERLRESTFQAFQNLVELCIKNDAKFLVIAGDVYDGADRSVRAQLRFRDGLSKLAENGIQSFIIHGSLSHHCHSPNLRFNSGKRASIRIGTMIDLYFSWWAVQSSQYSST